MLCCDVKKFAKKFKKKFAGGEILSIFAPAFALKRGECSRGSSKNIFKKKSCQNIWWFQKYDLSLHSLFALNERGVEARLKWFFDLLVLYIERKV